MVNFKDLICKPEGGITIAKDSDKRPAVPPPALADFEEDFEDVDLLK